MVEQVQGAFSRAVASGPAQRLRPLLRLGGVALAYYLAAKLSLRVAIVGESITPIWPPTGIALVALLLLGKRVWPGIAVGAFAVNAPISPSLVAAAGITVGNTLAPLTAAVLLEQVRFRTELDRLRDAVALVFLAALGSMSISATGGTTALVASGAVPAEEFAGAWAVWWAGDAMGVLIFAPFLLTLATRPPRAHRPNLVRGLEAAFLGASLGAVTYAAFSSRLGIQYVVFPFLGWAAWRFQQRGAAPAALIASSIAVWAAVSGFGPFSGRSLVGKMVTLQVFNGGVALTSFVLAALMTERARASDELEERVRSRTALLVEANRRLEEEIAERARAVEALTRTGEQLADAQSIARIGSWEWDVATGGVTWSDELYRIHGLRPHQVQPTLEGFLSRIHPDERAETEEGIRRSLRTGEPFAGDARIVLPDGSVRWVRATGQVVPDDAGVPIRMFGTSQDITDRKRLEALRDEFISNAAHELRTPLATLATLGDTLATHLERMSPEQIEQALGALRRQSARASQLVADLLDLSQIETGRERIRLRAVDLAEALARVIEAAPPPEGKSVDVRIGDHLSVIADPGRLGQVLTNLVVNAYRYGGNRVVVEGARDGARVRLSVEDDGPGVAPDIVAGLFEPFTRAAGAPGGSGIGLVLCRRLVEAFGGTIRHERALPHGARFALELEAAEGPEAADG